MARFIKALVGLVLLAGTSPIYAQSLIERSPLLEPGETSSVTAWVASTDPKRKNDDYLLLKPGETRRIKLPTGFVERLWSTAFDPTKITLLLKTGQPVTIEGKRSVGRSSQDLKLLANGRAAIGNYHEKAYTLYPSHSAPAGARELGENAALVVTNHLAGENKFYYQVSIRTPDKNYVPGVNLLPEGLRSAPAVEESSEQPIPAGEERAWAQSSKALDPQRSTGFLRTLSVSLEPATLESWKAVRLKAYWDGGDKANIDVPLLALAGNFFAANPVKSALWNFDGKTLTLIGPIYFGKNSRVVLANTGGAPVSATVSYKAGGAHSAFMNAANRLCAAYGSARTQKGKFIEMLNVQGRGVFLGLNLAIAPVPETQRFSFAYLEGNEIITADGAKMEGTGTEDFFDSAWYFPTKTYSHPYAGMTYKGEKPPKISMYRLKVHDAVPFMKSLKFELGHGSSNSSNDLEYHWVAWWYQQPPIKFQVSDSLQGQWGATAGNSTTGNSWGGVVPLVFGCALLLLVGLTVMRIVRRPRR